MVLNLRYQKIFFFKAEIQKKKNEEQNWQHPENDVPYQ